MARLLIDDHLLRDLLAGGRSRALDRLGRDGLATTGLWLFRLCSSLNHPDVAGRLSAPVAALPEIQQAEFRAQLVRLPSAIAVAPLRDLAWSMAELQARHRTEGRHLSTAMAEALAAAHHFGGGIAVSAADVGPNLQAAATEDRVPFHVL